MSQKRTSYAFLMEMLWVCGFYALSACIFVLAFVKAENLSRNAENLNHAVIAAQNCLESEYSSYNPGATGPDGIGYTVSFYDENWTSADGSPADAAYTVTVSFREEKGLLHLTAEAAEQGGDVIYTLEGCKNLTSIVKKPMGPGSIIPTGPSEEGVTDESPIGEGSTDGSADSSADGFAEAEERRQP